jgi:fatty acid-binding protein DegV
LAEALLSRLATADEVLEVVRYRIGPSVGVHTGPGTAGACYYPARTT